MKNIRLSLAIVALLSFRVQAHEEWPSVTRFEWVPKHALTIPVKMNVVRWADITFCNDQPVEIVLHQISGTDDYQGCLCLSVCVNFAGLYIEAEYFHDDAAIALKEGGKKYVSLMAAGDPPNYAENLTTYHLTTLHLTGNSKTLDLCVKLTNVDMTSNWTVGDAPPIQIGIVKLNMWPSGLP